MRRRATVGCARPALHRLHADTIESTAQWMKKTLTNAWKAPSRGWPLLRDLRERERPDDEDRAQQEERVRKPAVRGAECVGEAEQEVREDDKERDHDPADSALGQVPGVGSGSGSAVRAGRATRTQSRPTWSAGRGAAAKTGT